MPKEPKSKTSKKKMPRFNVGESSHHAPLGQVMEDDERRGKYALPSRRGTSRRSDDEEEDDDVEEEELLDEKTSGRILELGQQQLQEVQEEEVLMMKRADNDEVRRKTSKKKEKERKRQQQKRGDGGMIADSTDEEDEDDDDEEGMDDDDDDDVEETRVYHDDGYVNVEGPGLSAQEEAMVARMMGGSGGEERKTLADIILDKIKEKEEQAQQQQQPEFPMTDVGGDQLQGLNSGLPDKVIQVYTDIGKILSRYTAGKLPKAFKVIPSLSNWEEVLYLTRPDMWTPQAMYAATRIFASNLNPKMAQRFYYLVLLDSVRADMEVNKRLNYHYYMSLKKAVYKPAAFFKGILLPLCKEHCTLREAAIVSSVLQRVSIPVHHSAVAIHKLCQLDQYNGTASIFIRTLLNKKYALPSPVIGSLVKHFGSFATTKPNVDLPVLWHQALLVFVQRYKNEVKDDARESLKIVMKVHYHPKITPEIRRELFGIQAFKEEQRLMNS